MRPHLGWRWCKQKKIDSRAYARTFGSRAGSGRSQSEGFARAQLTKVGRRVKDGRVARERDLVYVYKRTRLTLPRNATDENQPC